MYPPGKETGGRRGGVRGEGEQEKDQWVEMGRGGEGVDEVITLTEVSSQSCMSSFFGVDSAVAYLR